MTELTDFMVMVDVIEQEAVRGGVAVLNGVVFAPVGEDGCVEVDVSRNYAAVLETAFENYKNT